LELVGLSGANKKIGSFSRGMKQRLGVAQALIGEPALLICDEPTSALDPAGRKDILDILSQLRGRTTVIFSTHILSDVERICDRVAVLHRGKIAAESAVGEPESRRKTKTLTLEYDREVGVDELLDVLETHGLAPARYETTGSSVESLYLEVTK
ncbi:MAG: ABC transporter ATP-binding protein, partial [Eubacteriales bacterium]|nr:ABC transporter ATP-binding protein [Eubacteriales bacterium]